MKHLTFNKLFGWLAAASMLLAPSCVDDAIDGDWDGSDEVTVSFVISPESSTATRAGDETTDDATTTPVQPHISDGTKADMLVYAIYDKDGNQLHEGYGKGTDKELEDLGFEASAGQTMMKVDKFPVVVNIRMKRGVEYQVAFWAQSSRTKAYNIKDLRKVEVNYTLVKETNSDGTSSQDKPARVGEGDNGGTTTSGSMNNDELRDAFCRSVRLTAGESGKVERDIWLYRPLAQINIGTRGYDYEIATREMSTKYTYSKIRLNRVARYLDVIDDKIITSTTETDETSTEETTEAFAVVDFDYAPLPAYEYMPVTDDGTKIPQYPSYTVWDWIYTATDDLENPYLFEHPHKKLMAHYAGEEFLRVKLDWTGKEDRESVTPVTEDSEGYLGYANYNNHNDVTKTETFKWLSMCYVLTNSSKTVSNTDDASGADVLSNVKVWLAPNDHPTKEEEFLLLDINLVPAQRNWRTNIVGNLITEEQTYSVTLDKAFSGEYNGLYDGKGAQWSGPLAKGVYYDGVKDEIQISSADGLLWFQRMVNGDLKVRKWITDNIDTSKRPDGDYYFQSVNKATKAQEGDYYKQADGEHDYEYDGYAEADIKDPDLIKRILYATHQDMNESKIENADQTGCWPKKKNFHFIGTPKAGDTRKAQATVKLMADIDLSGIEWIPIGFDGRIAETVRKYFYEKDASNRGFYGIFDGNGHTISNLSTKRFSARVADGFQQEDGRGPYDVPQWFARGLFGMIGDDAKVKNVRLLNVDVYGCQCVGAVVGAAQGDRIEITNCIVDGGKLIVTPMYRGDSNGGADRTFARGVYLGGIVGYFLTKHGVVKDCEVKNLFMQGYRRVGGIVGSTVPYNRGVDAEDNETSLLEDFTKVKASDLTIEGNMIANSTILASQFSTFGMPTDKKDKVTDENGKEVKVDGQTVYELSVNNWKYIFNGGSVPFGFGWDKDAFNLYAHEFVGGHAQEQYPNNVQSNLTFSEITEKVDRTATPFVRIADVQSLPLEHMPMLSAWYADQISLHANYYGKPSAKKRQLLKEFTLFSSAITQVKTGELFTNMKLGKTLTLNDAYSRTMFWFPMNLPGEVDVLWQQSNNKNAGLYVGSVKVTGNVAGRRSVITPTEVTDEGACAIYVCPEYKHQYCTDNDLYKGTTVLENLTVRGMPYAHTGVLLAPNKNSKLIELKDVAIYDVYQTIAMDTWSDGWSDNAESNVWPTAEDRGFNHGNTELKVTDCNLRGYTVPGGQWSAITYTNTTLERGMTTGEGQAADAYTCKVETYRTTIDNKEHAGKDATITFDRCFFKAPYIIDLTEANLEKVVFKNNCEATGATRNNVAIDLRKEYDIKKIVITADTQGDPVIQYFISDGTYYDKDYKHYDAKGTEITD